MHRGCFGDVLQQPMQSTVDTVRTQDTKNVNRVIGNAECKMLPFLVENESNRDAKAPPS
jgi:hypothetical protein